MGSCEWTVGKGKNGYDGEEEGDANDARPDVVFHVRLVSEMEKFRVIFE